MFNVSVNDKKNIYRSKPVMNVDTVPKPLTYDYMPEGYPSKGVGTVTLMEEQEVTFYEKNGLMGAVSPVVLDAKPGDKLTVVWDGVSYDAVVKTPEGAPSGVIAFGNLGLIGIGDTEDYPFVYDMFNSKANWVTADTAATHTIKVMLQQETITPMSTDFIPKNFNVAFSGGINSSIPDSCNVTYDELRSWIKNGVPVFAAYKVKQDDGSVFAVGNIVGFEININTDSISVYYLSGSSEKYFKYNSNGTFSGSGVES